MEKQESKVCKACGRELPITEFYLRADGSPRSYCKSCNNRKTVQYLQRKRAEGKCEGGGTNKVFSNPELAKFTPAQLMKELAARGYHATGKVTRDFSF